MSCSLTPPIRRDTVTRKPRCHTRGARHASTPHTYHLTSGRHLPTYLPTSQSDLCPCCATDTVRDRIRHPLFPPTTKVPSQRPSQINYGRQDVRRRLIAPRHIRVGERKRDLRRLFGATDKNFSSFSAWALQFACLSPARIRAPRLPHETVRETS